MISSVVAMLMCMTSASPPASYLLRVESALERCRADIPSMLTAADEAATSLASGGSLWIAGPSGFISELTGRAGGFMMAQDLGGNTPAKNDVVLLAHTGTIAPRILDSGALLVLFTDQPVSDEVKSAAKAPVHVFNTYATESDISPTLAPIIPGWIFTGELFAALTRQSKTPVMYQSIGIYGGIARINKYAANAIWYHEDLATAPVAHGVIGNRFADEIGAMLRRVETEQRSLILRAAVWSADARRSGKRTIMYSMGHVFPSEIENTAIGSLYESAMWNSGFFDSPVPEDTYQKGDAIIHIGYQHPPYRLLPKVRQSGARLVYVDLMRHRDYADDPDIVWLDPMWPWLDACVPVDGYDVPLLASSGIVNGAIAWEIYRLASELLADGE